MDETQKWLFIESLRESPNVSEAARVAGVGRSTAYDYRASDPEFAQAWDHAIGASVDRLEVAAFKRATDGWLSGRTFDKDGHTVGETYKVSDSLVPLLLKAHKPDVYARPEKVEHSGSVEGGACNVVILLPDNGRDPVPAADG